MRADANLDHGIAGLAAADAWAALAFEPQRLAVGDARRNRQIERGAVRHGHALLGAEHRLQEFHLQGVTGILALQAEAGTLRAARAARGEEVGEDIAEAEIRARSVASTAASATPRPSAPRTAGLAFIAALRIAIGVDLAAVELPALFGVAEDLVGTGYLLEALRRSLVAGPHIRMQLLGELAERTPDVVVRCSPVEA